MKLLGRSKPEKPRPGEGPGEVPRLGASVRLRLTMSTGPTEDLVVEVPTVVVRAEPSVTATGRNHLMLTAADVGFLPTPPDLTIEHALLWTTSGGHMELPVLVSSLEGPLWRLVITGPVRRVQRRNFVRVAIRMPAHVVQIAPPERCPDDGPREGAAATTGASGEPTSDAAAAPEVPQVLEWDGTIVDLGEGGVRCAVRGTPPAQGSRIAVSFGDGSTMIHCRGVVVRFLPIHGINGDATALAIRFDDPEEHGDTIRRLVFAEQLRLRQSHLEIRQD